MISIYVVQIILILSFGLFFRNNKKRFLIATFIVLFIVMAFRDARIVGNDSASSYLIEFSDIEKATLSWPNPGVPMIMKVIQSLNGDYQWVIIITAIWVCFAYYKLLVKYSVNGFISVMWFMGMLFYTFLFSALKQAWAMAFLCFAFDAVFQKKPVRYLVFVFLAAFFHFPALIFLPAYLIAKLKVNRAFPLLMFSILVFVYTFRTQILDMMSSTYTKGSVDYSVNAEYTGMKFVFMIFMLAYGFYQYFVHSSSSVTHTNMFSVLLFFMGIAAVIQTFCLYSNNFERLADYYYQFSILFVPMILLGKDYELSQIEKNDSALSNNYASTNISGLLTKKNISSYSIEDIDINTVLTIIIAVFCVWRFISITGKGADNLTPFYFFWQNVHTSLR